LGSTMSKREIAKKGLEVSKTVGRAVWEFAKSEKAFAIIKVAATFAAFISSVEELRKTNRKIGFRK